MKIVAIREAKAKLSGYCALAQDRRVLITRHGKPLALVIGVEGQDVEDVLRASDPAFWRLIEKRRAQDTVPAAEMRRLLSRGDRARSRTPRRAGAARKSAQ